MEKQKNETQTKEKNKNKKKSSKLAEGGEGQMVGRPSEKTEVEKQLLSLSASSHTKLLVSPDSEQHWFDQVSPPATISVYIISDTI